MFRTVSAGYAERIAERMYHESHALASDWLARLDSILVVDVNAIFPTTQLLDHVPSSCTPGAPGADEAPVGDSSPDCPRRLPCA